MTSLSLSKKDRGDLKELLWISPYAEQMLRQGGKVCGVFSSALAVACSGLAVMLEKDHIAVPLGGVLSEYRPDEWWQVLGEEVTWQGDRLLFGNRIGCDTNKVRQWQDLTIKKLPALGTEAYAQGLRQLKHELHRCRRETGSSLVLGTLGWSLGEEPGDSGYFYRFAQSVKLLRQGVLRADLSLMEEAQEGLVGFGTGLTPSGDDFLTGFWGTMKMRYKGRHSQVYEEAAGGLTRLAQRTTIYGYSELWAMEQGFLSQPLIKAIKLEDLEGLAQIGGTTGADTLLGIAEAFRLLEVLDGETAWT